MADKRSDAEDGARIKRQKTEDMDKSSFYLGGMSDFDGGVPLSATVNKLVKAESEGYRGKCRHKRH